ncbi:hypothetical protein HY478_02265, partial [Candidatus Uhrbacteria bacterium]|nr:hypothetical protein [Candidatus Uhrbacteria bacterium]
ANIGGSGYQIISQGEADRILNASPRERREMVEDALGLKLYQHKKVESERKLQETDSNIEKTKSLRREIAPHLNFLRTQVQRIEKARELKDDLALKLREYLAREHAYLTAEDSRLREEDRSHDVQLKRLANSIAAAESAGGGAAPAALQELQKKLSEREAKLSEARRESERLGRELGRAEGLLEATNVTVEAIVPVPHVRQFVREVESALAEGERVDELSRVRNIIADIRGKIAAFLGGLASSAPVTNEEVRRQVEALGKSLERVRMEEKALSTELASLRSSIAEARERGFEAGKELVELEAAAREAQSKLELVRGARSTLGNSRERFNEEVREGVALLGTALEEWERGEVFTSEDRSVQEKRRRDIERLKIKIEESGVGNGEAVVREFTQTKERDEFLARELADLEKSAVSLKDIIAELEKTIDTRFQVGLKGINEALKGFFSKLFGGGEAKLRVEEPRRKLARSHLENEEDDEDGSEDIGEEEELYAGLSISVSLPRKKIKGLEVLSGGERALTSIALIFSMTQVNPPPFLVLDETDAALDEANSKRYADMIRELAHKSQLIVITHNRATMAVAGELYGVTMDSSGVSKVLSVKLEEATKVAK